MLNNILVPLDGSENAYRALEYAANLAKKFDAQVSVLSVFRHHSYIEKSISMVRPREPENLDDVLSAYAKEVVAQGKSKLKELGVEKVRGFIKMGTASRKILEFAQRHEIDLIIIGSKGNGDLKGYLLGGCFAQGDGAGQMPGHGYLTMTPPPTLHDVYRAHARIKPLIVPTPLWVSEDLARQCGARSVHLKLECLQNTGAFKVRGAANKILSLTPEEKQRGVITFSTGNHGKAVAYVAGQTGIKALVCLSEHVDTYRAEIIQSLGAEVSVKGDSQDEAEKNYQHLAASRDLVPVVPFDDPLIVAGQGTAALEILAALPDTEVMLVQLSGGGLLAGIAMAAKSINPKISIVGVSLEQSPAMLASLDAGKPVQVKEKDSIADSLLGGIGFDNRYTLPLVNRFSDEHVLVGEEEIKDGIFHLFEKHRLIVEGAAAVGVSALLHRKFDVQGKRVVALLTGGSINSDQYIRIIQSRLALYGVP